VEAEAERLTTSPRAALMKNEPGFIMANCQSVKSFESVSQVSQPASQSRQYQVRTERREREKERKKCQGGGHTCGAANMFRVESVRGTCTEM